MYTLLICLAFYVIGFSLTRLISDNLFSQKVQKEQRVAEECAVRVGQRFTAGSYETVHQAVVECARAYGGRVMLLDDYGVVQADAFSEMNGQRLTQKEVWDVLNGATDTVYGYYWQDLTEGARSALASVFLPSVRLVGLHVAKVVVDGAALGAVVYATTADDMLNQYNSMQNQMMFWFIAIAFVVILISWWMSNLLTRPVRALNDGITHISQGDFSHRVAVRGANEFAQLAGAFNAMTERMENLDTTRNQFVSNASHELKTPLSTIKILTESLLYQEQTEPALQKEFMLDINKEIDRLTAIITDLLVLVRSDSGEMRIRFSNFMLGELVKDTAHRIAPFSRDRGIDLEVAVKDDVEIEADRSKLEQVVYNLVDNAIKYTIRGGTVRVEVFKDENKACFRVTDTGIGIPKQDIMHIFDRFYRVDKARSRETGGTGLGLAIVKQVVLAHNGTISVKSDEGVGTTFLVQLPL